ncbi:MAG: glycosyltransferase family 2 protein, partial [Anderseniella sp.]|nr:glycosyltransferase family 2 protein [Anderseniella sp.]
MTAEIHAIILTFNEERHIARCIRSLGDQCASITVIDSESTDQTREISEDLGAEILINPFVNHAEQVNFAIDQLAHRNGWFLRIDADEVVDSEASQDLATAVDSVAADVDGVLIKRRIHFMGRRIRHGGIEPNWQLRLWRSGTGRCENRWMDEHLIVAGRVQKSEIVLSDINLNPLDWWISKHNSYASREAVEVLNSSHHFKPVDTLPTGAGFHAKKRSFLKNNIYNKVPAELRSLFYFIFRYFVMLGFLDGKAGWHFHVLQGFWYRFLVDAKLHEVRKYMKQH